MLIVLLSDMKVTSCIWKMQPHAKVENVKNFDGTGGQMDLGTHTSCEHLAFLFLLFFVLHIFEGGQHHTSAYKTSCAEGIGE